MFEPCFTDRRRAVRRAEDDVEKMLAVKNLAEPALVLDSDCAASLFEKRQDARKIPGLAKNVEVLGLADDPGIGAERIGAGEKERNPRRREFANGLRVEGLRFRVLEGRLGARRESGAAARIV